MLQPKRLRAGSRVAVVAPGGPIEPARCEAGVARLRELGLTPIYDERLFARQRYLAGPDAQRLTLLQGALDDPAIDAVWAVRGGYGVTRLLPSLRLREQREHPKLCIGFSDITALHAALNAVGVGAVHGPNVGQLAELTAGAFEQLRETVLSSLPPPALFGAETLVRGRAEGLLLGGNLTLLSMLVGTPHLPSFAGAILLLEDVNEAPYKLDRALTHLATSGALGGLRGLALGTFVRCDAPAADYTARAVLEDLAHELGVPAALGFPVGHLDDNHAVPLGVPVVLDASEGKLTFLGGLSA